MKDIAKRAQVAVSTVSYVVNSTKPVRPETRQRVMEAIAELNYNPSSVARSLKTKRSSTIGIVLPDITNDFFTEVVRGIEDHSYADGYDVILCNTDRNPGKERKYLQNLYSKDVDGIIFIGTCMNEDVVRRYAATPVVCINSPTSSDFSFVAVNHERGGYAATRHLLETYDEPVVLISGPLVRRSYCERRDGYRRALSEFGVPYRERLVFEIADTHQCGFNVVDEILQHYPEVRAVFATSDVIALGAIRGLYGRGRRIPQDTAVVGYDDIAVAAMFIPALTTVQQPKYVMGTTAAQMLIEAIADPHNGSSMITLEPKLIVRESA